MRKTKTRARLEPPAKPSPGRTAVMYVRVSSKEQEQGFSIPAQRQLLNEYAEREGIHVVQEFEDVETAKRAGRAAFGEMVTFLSQNASSCRIPLVEKTDRLYRNIRDWVTIDELNLEVHFVKENVVLSEGSRSSEKFMHGIKVLMVKNYIDNLGEEVRKGMIEKARQGHWPTVAPVGYQNNLVTHRIEPAPDRAPIIARLFEWYASGQYSLKALTKMPTAAGLTNRTGGNRCRKRESISCPRIPSTTASSTGWASFTRACTRRSSLATCSTAYRTCSVPRTVRGTRPGATRSRDW